MGLPLFLISGHFGTESMAMSIKHMGFASVHLGADLKPGSNFALIFLLPHFLPYFSCTCYLALEVHL